MMLNGGSLGAQCDETGWNRMAPAKNKLPIRLNSIEMLDIIPLLKNYSNYSSLH
jgi:hypothetical protein